MKHLNSEGKELVEEKEKDFEKFNKAIKNGKKTI